MPKKDTKYVPHSEQIHTDRDLEMIAEYEAETSNRVRLEDSISDLPSKFYTDVQHFVFANSVLSAAAGFSIGAALKSLIEDLMDKFVLPILVFIVKSIKRRLTNENGHLYWFLVRLQPLFDIGWSVIMFVSIVILTFVVLEYVINKEILGMRTRVRLADKDDFSASRVMAKYEGINPLSKLSHSERGFVDVLRGWDILKNERDRYMERLKEHQRKMEKVRNLKSKNLLLTQQEGPADVQYEDEYERFRSNTKKHLSKNSDDEDEEEEEEDEDEDDEENDEDGDDEENDEADEENE